MQNELRMSMVFYNIVIALCYAGLMIHRHHVQPESTHQCNLLYRDFYNHDKKTKKFVPKTPIRGSLRRFGHIESKYYLNLNRQTENKSSGKDVKRVTGEALKGKRLASAEQYEGNSKGDFISRVTPCRVLHTVASIWSSIDKTI